MNCSACGKQLSSMQVGDLIIEACAEGCGGIWLDRDEIIKVDENRKFPGSPILDLAKNKESVHIDHTLPKTCPKCGGEPLVRQFFDVKHEVEIDQCWSCGGIWLDPGELNMIRVQYETSKERAKAVDEYIDDHLADTDEAMSEDTRQTLRKEKDDASDFLSRPLTSMRYALMKLLRGDPLA